MTTPPYTLPAIRQAIVDPKTGLVDPTWYRFLVALFKGTGSGTPLGTAANANAGSSGHTLPFLDANNTWSGAQTLNSGDLLLAGATSGTTAVNATAVASGTLTLPAATDTLVGKATTDVLTNKSISGAANTLSNIATSSILFGQLTNSLAADVNLNNVANYFDGPIVAQGTVGTWFVSGTVTLFDTAANSSFFCKLWDGTTVIASAATFVTSTNPIAISLSGFLASPVASIRISCRDPTAATGLIKANQSGNAKDSTISAFRIA